MNALSKIASHCPGKGYFITVCLGLILVVYAGAEISFLTTEDLTADEPTHYTYAIRLLKGNVHKRAYTTDDSKMPVSVLNTIPRVLEQLMHRSLAKNDNGQSDTKAGRFITFLVSLFTLMIVFRWAKEWYGPRGGFFSMALSALCPNLLAHSGLVTTDAYSALIFLLVLYTLWKYLSSGQNRHFIAFAVWVGIAQITKQTFTHLYICIPIVVFLYKRINQQPVLWGNILKKLSLFFVINIVIINCGFLFYRTGLSLNDYVFTSKLFATLQSHSGILGNIPLPLPEPYLTGLDTVKYFDELGGGYPGSSFGLVTILGNHKQGASYWFYYPVTLLFKTPLPSILFFVLAVRGILRRSNRSFFKKNEILVLLPCLYFLAAMSFFNHIQSGVRHLIFLYPPVYILCGRLLKYPLSNIQKTGFIILSGWLIASVGSYYNCYISYTNELITDKKNAFQIVGGSNLDFGQGGSAAAAYIRDHPDVQFATAKPGKGKFLIPVGKYEDNFGEHTYNWLQHYPPIAQVHHCYLLVEVK